MAKYSLAKYILTISIPAQLAALYGLNTLTIGGQGSYTDSININYNDDMYKIEGDVTGSYVYNRSDNKTGSIAITLNQLADKVSRLKTLCNIYKSSEQIEEGLTLTLRASDGTMIATCLDCLPQRIPEQAHGPTAGNQTWTFLSGEITFH